MLVLRLLVTFDLWLGFSGDNTFPMNGMTSGLDRRQQIFLI